MAERQADSAYGWAACLCCVVAATLWVGPFALRPDLFYDDVAHHVFWLYRYADPTLFPGDITIPYFRTSAPWGYRAIYAALVPFTDALLAAKLLSLFPLAGSAFLAWHLGAATATDFGSRGARGLVAVAVLLILLPMSQQRDLLPPIAFQRAFALPLLLMTVWGLLSQRYAWVGISWLAAALLYPVVLPVQGLTAAAVFGREFLTSRRLPRHWAFNAVAGASALLIAAIAVPIPPEVGPPFSYEEAIRMPEFGPHGRLNLYAVNTVGLWLTGHRTGLGWSPWVLLLIVLATTVVLALRAGRQIPYVAWTMAFVGCALWAAMRAFPEHLMFDLYLPNRHSRWAIGIFGMFVLCIAVALLLERWPGVPLATMAAPPGAARRSSSGWIMLVPAIVAAALLPNAIRVWSQPVDHHREATYAFLGGLPSSTLIAAHPDLADFVPVRTQRSVLASTEVSMAWMKGYYAQMKPRVAASLRAAYATSIEDMDAALEPYGVDVMLTGPMVWDERSYNAPFDGLFRELMASGEREGFVLKNPPVDRILFRSGGYYVVRVGPCRQPNCQ